MTAFSPFSSTSLFFKIEPDLLQRFKDKFNRTEWESLENYLSDERKLGILKNKLFNKLSKIHQRFEKEWKMNVEEKCQLINEMEDCLYELQLVEHALKIPLMGVAKIIFSINPVRFADKGTSQIKQKPAKRRKNELGGLVDDLNDDLSKIPAREAKLLAVTQVQRHHQEERFEELLTLGIEESKKGKLKRRAVSTANRTVRDAATDNEKAEVNAQSAQEGGHLMENDDEQQATNLEEEKHGVTGAQFSNNTLLNAAQIPTMFCGEGYRQEGSMNSPQRTESTGNCSSELMHSSPRTRATKKRSQETDNGCVTNEPTRFTNAKSPRKRRASITDDHPQQNEGINEIDEMELGEAEDKTRMGRHQKQRPDEAEPTYCLCEQVSFGEMICCDYELCSVEWFHFACVNIKSKPKGKKWFCPLCRYNDKANMLRPELLDKLDLARHRSQ